MSGEKIAVIKIATTAIATPTVTGGGAASVVTAATTAASGVTGGGAASVATATTAAGGVAMGSILATGIVVVGGTIIAVKTAQLAIEAAKKLELERHQRAVTQCVKNIKEMLKNNVLTNWATNSEKKALRSLLSDLQAIKIPKAIELLNEARRKNGQSAELMRSADEIFQRAKTRKNIHIACVDINDALSGKYRNRLDTKRTALINKVSELDKAVTRKSELNQHDVRELEARCGNVQAEYQAFKKCIEQLDKLEDYIARCKEKEWTQGIDDFDATLNAIAEHSNLTAQVVNQYAEKLTEKLDQHYDWYIKNTDKILESKKVEREKLENELERRKLIMDQLSNSYRNECPNSVSNLKEFERKIDSALYKGDIKTAKACLGQFDQLTTDISNEYNLLQKEKQQKIAESRQLQSELFEKLNALTELLTEIELPDDFQSHYQSNVKDWTTKIAEMYEIKKLKAIQRDAEALEKRLPMISAYCLALRQVGSLLEMQDDIDIDSDVLDELKIELGEEEQEKSFSLQTKEGYDIEVVIGLEQEKLNFAITMPSGEQLECCAEMNQDGTFNVVKLDKGEGKTCEAFKKWMASFADEHEITMIDKNGELIDFTEEAEMTSTQPTRQEMNI